MIEEYDAAQVAFEDADQLEFNGRKLYFSIMHYFELKNLANPEKTSLSHEEIVMLAYFVAKHTPKEIVALRQTRRRNEQQVWRQFDLFIESEGISPDSAKLLELGGVVESMITSVADSEDVPEPSKEDSDAGAPGK
tara:strand:+ start:471 stop:878 length:408 start_codon:yes stop_codon:yes gene_type:complete